MTDKLDVEAKCGCCDDPARCPSAHCDHCFAAKDAEIKGLRAEIAEKDKKLKHYPLLVKNLGETSAALLEFLTGRRCCDNGLFGQEHECQKQDGGRYV